MSDADRVNGNIAAHLHLGDATRVVAVIEIDKVISVHIDLNTDKGLGSE